MATNWGGWKSHQPPLLSWRRSPTRAHPPPGVQAGRVFISAFVPCSQRSLFWAMRCNLWAVYWEAVSVDRGVYSRVLLIRLLFPANSSSQGKMDSVREASCPGGSSGPHPRPQRAAVHWPGGVSERWGRASADAAAHLQGDVGGTFTRRLCCLQGAPCSSVNKQILGPDVCDSSILFIGCRQNVPSNQDDTVLGCPAYTQRRGTADWADARRGNTGQSLAPPPSRCSPAQPGAEIHLWGLASPLRVSGSPCLCQAP